MTHIHDSTQRQAALNINESFIIQAPAGSGKTELLIQRYLSLMCYVQKPEEIVAITFTRKAANEMRQRILAALLQAQDKAEPSSSHGKLTYHLAQKALAQDIKFQWNIFANPQRLQVHTIDALCARLVSYMPILSHFGVKPNITDNPLSYYEQAVAYLLQDLESNQSWSKAIHTLYEHLDNNESLMVNLLVNMLANREQWLPYLIHSDHQHLKLSLEEGLKQLVKDHLDLLNNLIPPFAKKGLKTILHNSAEYLMITWNNEEAYWRYVSQILLTTKGEWRKSFTKNQGFPPQQKANKQEILVLMEALKDHHSLQEALWVLNTLPPTYYEEEHWVVVENLLTLLTPLTAYLEIVFQEKGEVDFSAMTQGALHALGEEDNPTDLALYYDYRIQHLLIDECQDTSLNQYRFLKRLTAGWTSEDQRTLFLVGDPMQSIYRFRQAEVSLFLQMKHQGLGEKKLRFIQLKTNFRSNNSLVNWFNHTFKSIFPEEENTEVGAITHSSSLAHNEVDIPDPVTWYFAHTPEQEANCIVASIQAIRKNYPDQSVAILGRARSHLKAIIAALIEHNIPYVGVDLFFLWDIRAVRDVVILFKALSHYGDRLAWLSLLRTPFIGLNLADLHFISQTPQIWPLMQAYEQYDQISADGKLRLSRVVPVLQKSMQLQYQLPMDQWLEETWLALGGEATVTSKDRLAIHELLKILRTCEVNALYQEHDLLEKLCRTTAFSEVAYDANPVQLMTIHKAKGLEFDRIFIPQLQRRIQYEKLPLLHWWERPTLDGSHLFISCYEKKKAQWPLYHYIHNIHKQKALYEAQRLLYVACTRAKNHVYLSAEIRYTEEDKVELPSKNSFLYALWDQASVEHLNLRLPDEAISTTPLPFYRLANNWLPPVAWSTQLPSIISTSLPAMNEQIEIAILSEFYQAILKFLAEHPSFIESTQLSFLTTPVWQQRLRHLTANPSTQLKILNQVKLSLPLVLADVKAQWILNSTHEEAACQVNWQYFANGKLKQVTIPRMFIDRKVRWVIDYKIVTDLSNLTEYQQQLSQAQSRWNKDKTITTKVGFYFPLQQHWETLQ